MSTRPGRAAAAAVTGMRVDDRGIRATSGDEAVLDVMFDGRRVWSFWLQRDGEQQADGSVLVGWPRPLRKFLDGHSRLSVVVRGVLGHAADPTGGQDLEGSYLGICLGSNMDRWR